MRRSFNQLRLSVNSHLGLRLPLLQQNLPIYPRTYVNIPRLHQPCRETVILKSSKAGFVKHQPGLIRWFSQAQYPVAKDLDSDEQESELKLQDALSRINCDTHKSALEELGVQNIEDLSMLKESDLISRDIPLIHARKIMKIAPRNEDSDDSVSNSVKEPFTLAPAQQAMVSLNEFGIYRADRSYKAILISSILGGCFISFGASMFVLLGGGTSAVQASLPGLHAVGSALIFPIGLSSIVLTQCDLLTSSMMYSTLPLVSGDVRKTVNEKVSDLAKLWGTNFVGNFVGCAGIACLASTVFVHDPFSSFVQAIAIKKTSYLATGTTMTAFTKAIGANWLVCLAVFQATTAKTSPGKMAALWLPITTFVALGLEHSVANMFFVPLGIWCGADISTSDFLLGNLVPVCLGNAVGGAGFVSFFHWQFLMKNK